mmetsp:Transcript_14180/g.40193  ORF Transcript_14180/g.40193 Transcript_14180/m.40193 type:complete len:201 (+) Transcript_14180:633-1235(+)
MNWRPVDTLGPQLRLHIVPEQRSLEEPHQLTLLERVTLAVTLKVKVIRILLVQQTLEPLLSRLAKELVGGRDSLELVVLGTRFTILVPLALVRMVPQCQLVKRTLDSRLDFLLGEVRQGALLHLKLHQSLPHQQHLAHLTQTNKQTNTQTHSRMSNRNHPIPPPLPLNPSHQRSSPSPSTVLHSTQPSSSCQPLPSPFLQ